VNTVQFTLTNSDTLSLENTLKCGQSFRWQKLQDGSYIGIVKGIPAVIRNENNKVVIKTADDKTKNIKQFWADYFDLHTDYSAILASFRKEFSNHPFTVKALEYGKGLRILQQDAWEMLISYIISQRLSIPRISAIIEELAKRKGTEIRFDDFTFHSFPSPEKIAELSETQLREIGLGYRTNYITQASQVIINKGFTFDNLRSVPLNEALEILMQIHGVGPKVANCVCLFGLGKPDAFPVDTWIAKANKYYDGKLNASLFGQYAGIAQEYIFHYVRHIERK
jgi:N-glycosylase/DNA lyase